MASATDRLAARGSIARLLCDLSGGSTLLAPAGGALLGLHTFQQLLPASHAEKTPAKLLEAPGILNGFERGPNSLVGGPETILAEEQEELSCLSGLSLGQNGLVRR